MFLSALLLFHFLKGFTSHSIRRVVYKYSSMCDSMSISFYSLIICCCCNVPQYFRRFAYCWEGRGFEQGKEEYIQSTYNFVIKQKFVCLTHSEARHTKMLEFGAEKALLQGQVRMNGWLVLMLRNSQISEGSSKASLKAK